MPSNKLVLLVLICIMFSVARFFIPTHPLSPHGSYEAFAHLFVGGLIGAWLATKEKLYLILTVLLSAVELTAFLTLK